MVSRLDTLVVQLKSYGLIQGSQNHFICFVKEGELPPVKLYPDSNISRPHLHSHCSEPNTDPQRSTECVIFRLQLPVLERSIRQQATIRDHAITRR
ncbi:hypothetical protein PM082_004857 [Marasmius tenuissimus]|nr:hypothetical protein PM082_004857 [Marasmius tenuissimus]